MFLAATNFSLHFLLIAKKSFQYFNDSEFRFYITFIIIFFTLTFINVATIYGYTFQNVTASLFNTISILTTTGFTLYDYGSWPALSQLIVFFLFFIGGMAGSTSGGIKLIRTILVVKYIKAEITRMLHPRGLHHVKIGDTVIEDDIVRGTLGFYLFYILIFALSALVVSFNGFDIVSSLGISASSIGNIGPGLGIIGPTSNWASLNDPTKYLSMFCMLLGRLEIFTVLILFSRTYWRS
jgi:trk system potassium uptake protein TrkH